MSVPSLSQVELKRISPESASGEFGRDSPRGARRYSEAAGTLRKVGAASGGVATVAVATRAIGAPCRARGAVSDRCARQHPGPGSAGDHGTRPGTRRSRGAFCIGIRSLGRTGTRQRPDPRRNSAPHTALVALSQASALLEFAVGSKLSDIHPEVVQQGLWGVHSEIDRARVALNGENELLPREMRR